MIKAIIFDFDGVLVDSEAIKRDAWFTLFPDALGISKDLIADVLSRINDTRYDILKEILTEAGIPPDEIASRVNEYAHKYQMAIETLLFARGLMEGAKPALASLSQIYPLYINSITPEVPLIQTVERLGIYHFFKGVYGSPATKEENLEKVFSQEGISGHDAVFIGDRESDYASSRAVGCFFIGVPNSENGWKGKMPFPLAENLRMVEGIIQDNF